jgi:cell division protease FtsH
VGHRMASQLTAKRLAVVALAAVVLIALLVGRGGGSEEPAEPPAETVAFTTLTDAITKGDVELLVHRPLEQTVYASLADGEVIRVGIPGGQGLEEVVRLGRRNAVPFEVQAAAGPGTRRPVLETIGLLFPLVFLVLIVVLIVLLVRTTRGGRGMKIAPATSTVRFADVAGCGEVVEELADVRDFLSAPGKYSALGARVPKGVLLYGPPGTGKTLVAKAVASEAGIPFFAVSGSEFVEMYSGVGAARVRQLFKRAKEVAPCIVFIDEIDAVGRARSGDGHGGAREGDQTLNQLLTELDGFEVNEHPVVVIAASNRLDVLDPALKRPGRFDRHVAVDPPDRAGRLEVLRVHARNKALADDVDLEVLAAKTAGMAGADLANVLNEAALVAAKRGAEAISHTDVEEGFVRAIAGARKQNRALSEHERRVVAYHEAGHALAAELLDSPSKVEQISIVPRGQSAGHMIYSDEEEILLESRSQLLGRLAVMLAGRAAEEVVIGDVTTGAGDDLQRATGIVTTMITRLGMGDALGLYVSQGDTPAEARDEVKRLLADRYEAARSLLVEHRTLLDRVAEALLEEETLPRSRFLALIEDERELAADAELPPAAASVSS